MLSKLHVARTALSLALVTACSLALLAGPDRPSLALLRQKGDKGDERKEEEYDDPKPAKPKKKDVTNFVDPDDKKDKGKDKEAPPAPAVTVPTGDLKEAAKLARHPHVKKLYEDLATPHDRVEFRSSKSVTSGGAKVGGWAWVEPIPEFYARPADIKKRLSLQLLDERTGKRGEATEAGAGAINALRYYEQLAGDLTEAFLEAMKGFKEGEDLYLTRYNQLLAAEAALSRVVRFHESARKRGGRKGDEWDKVEEKLRGQLLGVLLGQVEELAASKSWDEAFKLSKRLLETYPGTDEKARIARSLAELLKKSLADTTASRGQLREAYTRLRDMQHEFPDNKTIAEVADGLRQRAAELARKAREVEKDDKKAALALLQQAEEIWPNLTGLRDLRVRVEGSYQVLKVGVRALPKYLSPGWAVTDSELRAVELQFESLVELVPDKHGALYYRSMLAEGRPLIVDLGRELRLPRRARWSNGRALTVDDLRTTLKLLQDGHGGKSEKAYRCEVTGRCVAWGDLLAGVKVEGDSSRVRVQLQRGLLDPMGAMSFKVLPRAGTDDPSGEKFATQAPVGSGPFRYIGQVASDPRLGQYQGFKANEYYGWRAGRAGLPRLSEVRFFATAGDKDAREMAQDVKDKGLDLVLDLTAAQAGELLKQGGYVVPLPRETTPNRRVYFLAVNHRRGDLGLDNADLRLALARAINREGLLDAHFRKGLDAKIHRALNGPYPAGSWACDPKLAGEKSADPYDPELARTKLGTALKKLGQKEVRLRLKYPGGSPELKAALEDLVARVAKEVPGLVLELRERSPYELRTEVEVTHDYELAYYSYDYPAESLWLFPLLGPSARGGGKNFLGYNGPLVAKAQGAATLRDFVQVRERARDVHGLFLREEMPLVPLWQLDPLYAYRRDERSGELVMLPSDPAGQKDEPNRLPIDTQKVFTRVEEWYLKGGK